MGVFYINFERAKDMFQICKWLQGSMRKTWYLHQKMDASHHISQPRWFSGGKWSNPKSRVWGWSASKVGRSTGSGCLRYLNCTPFLRLHQNPRRIFIFPVRSSQSIKHSPITTAFIHLFHLINMPLQALAEADYATLEVLVEAVQNHAFTEGYAIVKARSKSNRFGNVVKAVLSCVAVIYRDRTPKAQTKRRTDSIKCDCPFIRNAVYKACRSQSSSRWSRWPRWTKQ